MTEQPRAAGHPAPGPIGEEYSEVWIGGCAQDCLRPATVVIHGDFKLCALHALGYDARHEHDDATLALELLKPWRSLALAHGLGELVEELDAIRGRMSDRAVETLGRMRAFDRVESEADPEATRERMGERMRRDRGGAAAEPEGGSGG